MKTKAEQLGELKATAVKLQQQIEALEKPKQWEPRGGDWWVSGSGNVLAGGSINRTCKFGVERQTAEAAEKASAAMHTHNRLLAYVDEFGGDWEADWGLLCYKQNKYYIVYDNPKGEWCIDHHHRACSAGAVYMSSDCAEGLVAKLNSGEVVL